MKTNYGRVESLDYLRGFMALSVVIYHYVSWSFGPTFLGSENVLGRLGTYAVSTFYILSGVSLAYVYDGKVRSVKDGLGFIIKRIFRIAPLFWISITLALYLSLTMNKGYVIPYDKVVLNYTLSFGFVSPTSYFTTGAWSIGNELVFYAILCATYIISSRISAFVYAVFLLSLISWAYFAFFILDPANSLGSQWSMYVNPFNQLFFFMSGVMICKLCRSHWRISSRGVLLAASAICTALFCFYPVSGDSININSGWARVALSLSCIILVACIFIADVKGSGLISLSLETLGQVSYSIYLLHPLVSNVIFILLVKAGVKYHAPYVYLVSLFTVLLVGFISYRCIERPMMKVGARIVKSM